LPPAVPDINIGETFRTLVSEWKQQSRFLSSVDQMVILNPYQRIIGLGPRAVPFLLHELEHDPDYWFWALRSITGHDPVPEESKGKLREMAQAWMKWGRENGYSW